MMMPPCLECGLAMLDPGSARKLAREDRIQAVCWEDVWVSAALSTDVESGLPQVFS